MAYEEYIDEWAGSSLDWNEYGPGLYLLYKENPGYLENEMRDRGWQPGIPQGFSKWVKDVTEYVDDGLRAGTDIDGIVGGFEVTLFPGETEEENLWVENVDNVFKKLFDKCHTLDNILHWSYQALENAYARYADENKEDYLAWIDEMHDEYPDEARYDRTSLSFNTLQRETKQEYGQEMEPYPEIQVEDFHKCTHFRTLEQFGAIRSELLLLQSEYELYEDAPVFELLFHYESWQDYMSEYIDEVGGTIDFSR